MPRGGKREGAGAKPKMDETLRIIIGAACVDRHNAAAESQYKERLARELKKKLLGADYKRIALIPISLRSRLIWLRDRPPSEIEIGIRSLLGPSDPGAEIDERWDGFLATFKKDRPRTEAAIWQRAYDALVNAKSQNGLAESRRRRPQGMRKAILADVAAHYTALWKMTVTERMVRSCWKQFRAEGL